MARIVLDLRPFVTKAKSKLDRIAVESTLAIGNHAVAITRNAQPMSWNPPRPDHIPGAMRGNWRVNGVHAFDPEMRNRTLKIRVEESMKIKPRAMNRFTNTTPYLFIYEQKDAILARTAAATRQLVERVMRENADAG